MSPEPCQQEPSAGWSENKGRQPKKRSQLRRENKDREEQRFTVHSSHAVAAYCATLKALPQCKLQMDAGSTWTDTDQEQAGWCLSKRISFFSPHRVACEIMVKGEEGKGM